MSQVILTNWTIYFADDAPGASSGYKQIRWTGGGDPDTDFNTINELYSELMHYFSLPGNNDADDTIPMRAVTPSVYQIGAFSAGDLEPWFIDPISIQHLTGGSIQTIRWTRVQDSNAGIVKISYTPTTNEFVASDLGRTVTHDDGDTGTLLYFDSTLGEAWIRPTDDTSANNWDSGSGDFVATGGTGDVTQIAAPDTGNRLWSNIFTLGTIASNTRIYVTQDNVEIPNFWGNGQVDRLFITNDGFDAGLIDNGFFTVYARQFSKTYDNFVTDASGGGRNPVPLATGDDINITLGFRSVSVTGASGVFSTDEIVTGGTTGARGVVLTNTGTPTTSFTYYLLDDLTDFNSSEALTGSIVGSNGSTNGAPADNGPALETGITFTFGQIDATFNTDATGVDGSGEVITTSTSHPFATGNIIDYSQEGGSTNVGLTPGTLYYVNVLTGTTLSLHTSLSDALSDSNRVNLTAGSLEVHLLKRTYDVNEDSTDESFSIIIDCDTLPLDEAYAGLQYLTRRGETTATFNGIEGQQYIGNDYYIVYTALTGTIDTGDVVTQILTDGSTAFGTVQLHHTIDGFLVLRDSQGTFETGGGAANLEVDGSNFVTMTSATIEAISPIKTAPFGLFAGGKFFGARGVYLENFDGLDSNNVQFLSDEGNTVTPPLTVTFQLTGLIAGTEVRIYNSSVPDGTAGAEIAGIESSGTSFSYQYQYSGDITVHVMIHALGYVWQRLNNITLGDQNQSIPIQQRVDRNYSNP